MAVSIWPGPMRPVPGLVIYPGEIWCRLRLGRLLPNARMKGGEIGVMVVYIRGIVPKPLQGPLMGVPNVTC